MKVAAIVILYNPDKKILQNILSFCNQVEKTFIIDNSIDGNLDFGSILEKQNFTELIINNRNLGIAAALNMGIREAISEGFDYILTMDQDSVASEGMIPKLLSQFQSKKEAGLISPKHSNPNYRVSESGLEVDELNVVMTSGNIVSIEAFIKAGGFDEKLFIDYVDIDFCFRLIKNGYKIYRLNTAKLLHNEGNLKSINLFGKTIRTYNHNPIRWYYKIRNFNYIKSKYKSDFPQYVQEERIRIYKDIFKVLIFEKAKLSKLKWMIRGYFSYKKNIYGICPYQEKTN